VLDPAVLVRVADLEFVARVTVDGLVSGLHRSPFHGYSAEFSQYRHYRPGDDLKYVDWKLFARTDRLYTKQFRETTNMAAEIAVDRSASMAFTSAAGVSKLQYAVLLAATLAYLISRQGDAVGLLGFAEAVTAYLPPRPGQNHLRAVLHALSTMKPSGTTATSAALRRGSDLLTRRGALIVLSDLYDEMDETLGAMRRAARMGHEVTVFHLVTRAEIEFPYRDDAEFVDLETSRTLLVGAAAARSAYRRAFADFLEAWRSRCAAESIDYVRIVTDDPLDAALRPYLLERAARGA
jgi:uncharacterized protein (DUF58 family)